MKIRVFKNLLSVTASKYLQTLQKWLLMILIFALNGNVNAFKICMIQLNKIKLLL